MGQRRLPAAFIRGGTSKAVVFHRRDLPERRDDWDPIFLRVIGSPDPNGRQLDGMGGGLSSLSKVCVIGPPSRDDADVDFTFAQVSVAQAVVDYSANCGNMSSAIGPFAVDEGLVPLAPGAADAVVRIHNTNTGKIIVSRFGLVDGKAAVDGDYELDGVAGRGAPIRLDFMHPAGSRTGALLPTGSVVDRIDVPGIGDIRASMVDAATASVFVDAADLGLRGDEAPADLDAMPEVLRRLEEIRCRASVRMGIAPDLDAARRLAGQPRVGFVSAPAATRSLSGREYAANEMDLRVRMISMGQPHRAVQLTAALCIAAACRIEGSIPNLAMPQGARRERPLRLSHPSGMVLVDAVTTGTGTAVQVECVSVYRTSRRLFDGHVYY